MRKSIDDGQPPQPAIVSGEEREAMIGDGWLMRIDRAADIFQGLEREIDEWNRDHQLYAPARVPWTGEPVLEIYRPENLSDVPFGLWEAAFNDGVHNLRAALDGMCWELAHLDGAVPERPKRIYFPMTDSETGWKDVPRHLSTVAASLLERMRCCQPWARQDPQVPDPLVVLREADNDAKHRAGGFRFGSVPALQYAVRTPLPLPEQLANEEAWPIEPWVRLTIEPSPPRGRGELSPVFVMPVVIFGGVMGLMPDSARWLHAEVRRIVQFIASGQWPERLNDPDVSVVWAPVPLGASVGRVERGAE